MDATAFLLAFGTMRDDFRVVWFAGIDFMVRLLVLRCFPYRRALNGSTHPQSFKGAQQLPVCIST